MAAQVSESDLIQATALKEKGNALLVQAKYSQAAEAYTEALALSPTAILYSNRAQALIKLEAYGAAILDAIEAITLDPTYIKAYYRRGSSYFALSKFKLALKDFKKAHTYAPQDADALKKYKECDKRVKEEAFLAAIETETISDQQLSTNIENIVVDLSKYDGPVLQCDAENKPVVTMEWVKTVIEHFRAQKLLHRKFVCQLLLAAKDLFMQLPSLVHIPLPTKADGSGPGTVTVCGDTHGQFYDLLNVFEIGGFPSEENPYLFNGDFVDRGSFSFENVMTLILIKLACPSALHMSRGNHETKNMNKIYGFEGEVRHKYDEVTMNLFTQVFQSLPLAAVVQNAVFVVHGGLSTQPDLTLSDITQINRLREPPESGLMSDLLWADPQPLPGRSPSKRGVGFAFGPDFTEAFLQRNNLQLLVRSHEVKDEGYVEEHGGKCITVFSAPNYCDQMGNKGAMMVISEDKEGGGEGGGGSGLVRWRFTKFDSVPHPPMPPMRYANNMMGL